MKKKEDVEDEMSFLLTENMTVTKARRIKELLKKRDSRLWIDVLAIILSVGLLMLIASGICVFTDYMGWNEQETDWETNGVLAFCMPIGIILGYIIAFDTLISPLRKRVNEFLDYKLEEIAEYEESTETAHKPN